MRGHLGWATGLADRLACARGSLLPSLRPSTTEYALLEALGWGKPVVAFNVGAHADILRHRKNAMIVPVGDVDAFAEAVRELDRDPVLRQRIGAVALRTFERVSVDEELRRSLEAAYGLAGCPS